MSALIILPGLVLCLGLSGCDRPRQYESDAPRRSVVRESGLVQIGSEQRLLALLREGVRWVGVHPEESASAGIFEADGLLRSQTASARAVGAADEPAAALHDARRLYALDAPRQMLEIRNAASSELLSELPVEGEALLYGVAEVTGSIEQLVVVGRNEAGAAKQTTTLEWLDVRDARAISSLGSLELDGRLRVSRRIGRWLYLVSRFEPQLAALDSAPRTRTKRAPMEQDVHFAGARDLLPHYQPTRGSVRRLIAARDCLVPADLQDGEGAIELLVVAAVDLASRRIAGVMCFGAPFEGVYLSERNLYVAGIGARGATDEPFTVLHKFALDEGGVIYRASGIVEGALDWRRATQFVDESGADVRLLTTVHSPAGYTARLSILRESSSARLHLLATLPNAEHPAPLVSSAARAHAVHFFENRAYVLPLEADRPVSLLDLSNPAVPRVAGRIAVPAFAAVSPPLGFPGMSFRDVLTPGTHGGVFGGDGRLRPVSGTAQSRASLP